MFITESGSEPVRAYFSSSKTIDLVEIKKTVEKQIITNVLAPLLLAQRNRLQSTYDNLFTDVAKTVQESVKVAADQLDASMKGQFSKKVVTVIKENSEKYKEIQQLSSFGFESWLVRNWVQRALLNEVYLFVYPAILMLKFHKIRIFVIK